MGPGHGRGVERPVLLALRGSAASTTPLVRASSSRVSIVALIVRGRTTLHRAFHRIAPLAPAPREIEYLRAEHPRATVPGNEFGEARSRA